MPPKPKYRRGEDVVFAVQVKLTGLVREVKSQDGQVRYLIHGSFAFNVPESSILCRTAEAERVLGRAEAERLKRGTQDWWSSWASGVFDN
jgi:hypothetical protein